MFTAEELDNYLNKDTIKISALSTDKGKIMTNDTTVGTVELVRTETTGYLNEDGQFVYGTPPEQAPKVQPEYVQDGEDVVGE